MTFKTLNKILNNDIDYIATALTPWHAYGVVAAINKIENEKNCKLKGVVLIIRNFNEGYIINEQYFKSLDCKVYYFDYKRSTIEQLKFVFYKIRYILTISNNYKKNFYVLSQLTPNINILGYLSRKIIDRNFVTVICDEGSATYSIKNYKYKRRKVSFNSFFAKLYYFVEANVFLPILIKKLKYNNLLEDCSLLKYNVDKYVDNNIGRYFKNAISYQALNYKTEIEKYNFDKEYVIINTQPFETKDIIDEQVLFDLYDRIIYLSKNCGYKVYIKPHPREFDYSKYSFDGTEIIETKLTQEEFNSIIENKPRAIISIISTTLLTSSILFGIDTICIGCYLSYSGNVSRALIEGVEIARKKFSDIVYFPLCDSDFLEIINNKK